LASEWAREVSPASVDLVESENRQESQEEATNAAALLQQRVCLENFLEKPPSGTPVGRSIAAARAGGGAAEEHYSRQRQPQQLHATRSWQTMLSRRQHSLLMALLLAAA